jgi:uncharacterized sulfatase
MTLTHLNSGLIATALLASTNFSCTKEKESKKTNIIWITVEDLSPDLSCYGNNKVKTPYLDSISKLGVRFTNVFAAGAASSPSRTAFSTGFHQNSIGAHHMRYSNKLKPKLPNEVNPIHAVFKENGYNTANIKSRLGNTKTDWLYRYDGKGFDFSKWEEIPKSLPFYARINLSMTHRKFRADKLNPIDADSVKLPPYYPDHKVAREDWKLYLESIQVLDRQIKEVVSNIRKNKLEENTLIFFFSDHGRPFTRGKNFLYDSGLQVPLIVFSLDENVRKKYLNSGNNVDDALLNLIDINATSLNIAGITDYESEAISFLGDKKTTRENAYAAVDRIGNQHIKSRTVRTKSYRYIRNYNTQISINEASTAYRKANHPIYHLINSLSNAGKLNEIQKQLIIKLPKEELYQVNSDPYQIKNLASDMKFKHVLDEYRKKLDEWIVKIDDKGLKQDSPEIIEHFENYGKQTSKLYKNKIENMKRKVESQL